MESRLGKHPKWYLEAKYSKWYNKRDQTEHNNSGQRMNETHNSMF